MILDRQLALVHQVFLIGKQGNKISLFSNSGTYDETNLHLFVVLSDDPTSFTITVTSDAGENCESEYADVCCMPVILFLMVI